MPEEDLLSEHLDTVPRYFLSRSLSSAVLYVVRIFEGNNIYLYPLMEDSSELPMALAVFSL